MRRVMSSTRGLGSSLVQGLVLFGTLLLCLLQSCSPVAAETPEESLSRRPQLSWLSSLRKHFHPDVIPEEVAGDLWRRIVADEAVDGLLDRVTESIAMEVNKNSNLNSLSRNYEDKYLFPSYTISTSPLCFQHQFVDKTLDMCLESPQCSDVSLESFNSQYVTPTSLLLETHGLSLDCRANWSLSYTTHITKSMITHTFEYFGIIQFHLSNFDALAVVNFIPGVSGVFEDISIPASFRFDDCFVNESSLALSINFSGGIVGKILDLTLGPALSNAATNYMDWMLCYIISPIVEHSATNMLTERIDPQIDSIMAEGIDLPPVLKPGYFSWNSSILHTVHDIIDFVRLNEADMAKCIANEGNQGQAILQKVERTLLDSLRGLSSFDEYAMTIMLDSPFAGSSFEILSFTVHGFNSLHDLKLLFPSSKSNITLKTAMSFTELNIRVHAIVNGTGELDSVDMYYDLVLSDVSVVLDVVVGLRSSVLQDIFLDQIFSMSCFLTALEDLFVSSLLVDMDIDSFSVSYFPPSAPHILVSEAMALLLSGYSDMSSQLVKGLFQGIVRDAINDKISEWRNSEEMVYTVSECSAHMESNVSSWVHWPDSSIIQSFDKIVNDVFGPEGVNSFITCLTNGSNSVDIAIPSSFPIFSGWNVSISGLNSFYEFALLSAEESFPYNLNSNFGLGGRCTDAPSLLYGYDVRGIDSCVPFNVTIKGYEHNGNYVDVKLSLKDLELMLYVLFRVDKGVLNNMRVSEALTPGCLANSVGVLSVSNWSMLSSNVAFYFVEESEVISLTSLTNSLFSAIFSPSNQDAVNDILANQLQDARSVCDAGGVEPSSDDASIEDSDGSNANIKFLWHNWKSKVGILIVGTLSSFFFLLYIFYMRGVKLEENVNSNSKLVLLKSEENTESQVRFMNNKWLQRFFQSATSSIYRCLGLEEPQLPHFDAIIGDETISLSSRIGIVLLLAVTAYTFVISEIPANPASLVIMEMYVGKSSSPPITVFEFGLARTIREMWNAKVYYLAILIAFFTGGWPYIKLFVMLLAWILPSFVLSVQVRDSLLVWLDILGKWSLVDSFVMMVMMVGFNFGFDIFPGFSMQVTVNPQWSFYAFLLATAASLAIGHYVLDCHRLCVEVNKRKVMIDSRDDGNSLDCVGETAKEAGTSSCTDLNSESYLHSHWNDEDLVAIAAKMTSCPEKEALMDHVFSVNMFSAREDSRASIDNSKLEHHSDQTVSKASVDNASAVMNLAELSEWTWDEDIPSPYLIAVTFTSKGKFFMLVLFILSALLMLAGSVIPVIEFDFIGLTGYLMEEPITSYSLVDIGNKIPAASGNPHTFGVLFIQIIYFTFGIIMPVILFAVFCYLYCASFSLSTLRGVVMVTEVLYAWSALDVLVVSGVASVLQIRRFAEFMLGGSCDDIDSILEETMDETLDGHDTCFDVVASMKNTAWISYGAAFVLVMVGMLTIELGKQSIYERTEQNRSDKSAAEKSCRTKILRMALKTFQFLGMLSIKKRVESS